MHRIKDATINYLLRRAPIDPVRELMRENITDKVVMVTGAGGSIGSELCRQILQYRPRLLVMFELNEYALYSIHNEILNDKACNIPVATIIGDVKNSYRVRNILQRFEVDTVYHAAAYKHVPMVEYNISEGVRNNIIGTVSLANECFIFGVETFVLVSTDKAVRPTNVMGASKRVAEMFIQALAQLQGDTKFSIVRFGNVLGSSGSVVPLFLEQIAANQKLTVTHKDITRYFMSIPEAAQLVIQAGAMGGNGEVFVLDMGAPVKIYDMAGSILLIEKGVQPCDIDKHIEVTGLRPGEKLYEELLIGDNVSKTSHPRILKANEDFQPHDIISNHIDDIRWYCDCDEHRELLKKFSEIVSGFQHSGEIKDYLS
jgi:FlaA1/EpsC-like NDP-sugar epimerase